MASSVPRMSLVVVLGVLGLVLRPTWALEPRQTSFAEQCASWDPAAAGVPNATVTNHGLVGAGTNLSLPGADASCGQSSQVVDVDLCRVSLEIATTNRSGVLAEIWLPAQWNGRLVTTGNGGLGGCIDYPSIAYTASNGFASVGTNNGHNGTSGIQFLNNTDVVVDFSWRAVHVGVEAGKTLVSSLYQNGANASYFLACSLGGRQAVQAADMFPDDFNGIVAGAPAVDFNNLYSWRASFLPRTGAVGSPNFISPETWKTTIHNEVLRQCDTLDGVADGIIEDPILCVFDPSTLLCGGGDGSGGNDNNSTASSSSSSSSSSSNATCLSAAQVEIVTQVFSPYEWANGTLLYPGMNPGNELIAADGLYSGQPWVLSQSWFRYAVYNDPAWDPATYSLADAAAADAADPGHIRTWPTTLAAFQQGGGKMVLYHGGQDNQISSFDTPRFYEALRTGMAYTTDDMDAFVRFFRIPGMFHCTSGPGAWVVGQSGAGAAAQGAFDRTHNVLAAVVAWVEQGVAPETLTGTKFVDDTPSLGVAFARSHCRWPFRNVYLGGGLNPNETASWACQPVSAAEAALGASGRERAGNATPVGEPVVSGAVGVGSHRSHLVASARIPPLLPLLVWAACWLVGI